MSSEMSIKKVLIVGLLIAIITVPILGYMLWETKAENSFSSDIVSMCSENFGERRLPIISMYTAIKKENVDAPYTIFDNRYKGESMFLSYDILNREHKVLHVTTTYTGGKYVTNISYDTTQEQINDILGTVRLLVGDDAMCFIPETYYDYVPVYVQGTEYRWKDGILERGN